MDVKALAYKNMNENLRACLMQITFGLKRIEDVNRHIEQLCPMGDNFQLTDEFRKLNTNLITCFKQLEHNGITLKMLCSLKKPRS